ncbi:hypothetical protein NSPZN2_100194 [Nitrospira defluvii]|uniref:Uncharacterized protein n=1 Tax=Nitrospira defluvii TaxID=330214 RepID=A0ABM8R1T6_9BACT|nr:hypothetical protein NSPZN2_100194 [Nitrospira defluvii]
MPFSAWQAQRGWAQDFPALASFDITGSFRDSRFPNSEQPEQQHHDDRHGERPQADETPHTSPLFSLPNQRRSA